MLTITALNSLFSGQWTHVAFGGSAAARKTLRADLVSRGFDVEPDYPGARGFRFGRA